MPPKTRTQDKKGPNELVGLDFGASGVKAVRVKRSGDALNLVAADVLPLPDAAVSGEAGDFKLPKGLLSHYTALTFSPEDAVVRMLPQSVIESGKSVEAQLREQLSLKGEFRIGSAVAVPRSSKGDGRLLAVGASESAARSLLARFAAGPPAPCSLEIAGLAALQLMADTVPAGEHHVCIVEGGARVTTVAFIRSGHPELVRQFAIGGERLLTEVQERFKLDRDMALSISGQDGAIDLSGSIRSVFGDFMRQLCISRDFVERQENTRVQKLWVGGGLAMIKSWREELARVTGMEVLGYDPFAASLSGGGSLPDRLKGHESRFAAVFGAVRGVFFAS